MAVEVTTAKNHPSKAGVPALPRPGSSGQRLRAPGHRGTGPAGVWRLSKMAVSSGATGTVPPVEGQDAEHPVTPAATQRDDGRCWSPGSPVRAAPGPRSS